MRESRFLQNLDQRLPLKIWDFFIRLERDFMNQHSPGNFKRHFCQSAQWRLESRLKDAKCPHRKAVSSSKNTPPH